MSGQRFLVLGGGDGWHSNQLTAAAESQGCDLATAGYESLRSHVDRDGTCRHRCESGWLDDYDAILTRTMPAGSLERVTFRLAILHSLVGRMPIVNTPRSLEIAIDKYATLAHVGSLGYPVPQTVVAQSRRDAMNAFDELGGDCVVKPIFGGEGRGVSRIKDRELAWYTFATLDQLDAIMYVQEFVPPGGRDTRMLVIGQDVIGIRRTNANGFRTNQLEGAKSTAVELSDQQSRMAREITRSIGLSFASVDLIDDEEGAPRVLEVNAIPGWRSAQSVVDDSIAGKIITLMINECSRDSGNG